MNVVFLLGTVSRAAMEEGETLCNADIVSLEHISEKAGVEADIVLACQNKATWGRGSKASVKQVKAERHRVLQEVHDLAPEMVVAFGKTAAQCIFGRGVQMKDVIHQEIEHPDWPCGVWVTHSLEEASMKPGLVKYVGIRLLAAAKGELDVRWRDYVVTGPDDGPDPRLDLSAYIGSVDLETYPATNPRDKDARIRMVSISTSPDFAQVIQCGPCSEIPAWLRDWLQSGRTTWGGSNIQFDVEWLRVRANVVLPKGSYLDIGYLQHLLDENSTQKDLKTLVLLYTDIGDYSREHADLVAARTGKDEEDRWDLVEDHEMYQYAAADGYGGFEVFDKQLRELKVRGLDQALALHRYTYGWLTELQNNGAVVDMTENARLKDAYDEKIGELTSRVRTELGPINLNSPKQLIEALQKKLPGINLTENFWKKMDKEEQKYSTKKAVLVREAAKYPMLADLLEYRRRTTLRNFVKGIHKYTTSRVDGRTYVVSSIRGDITVTHRMSSSKPNLQNLPRDTREETEEGLNVKRQYVSRFPGGIIAEADQSQLELRVAAIISRDKKLSEAFLSGEDVHTTLAAMMRNCRPDQVTPEMRQAGKTTNFHVLYGGRAFGLSLRLGCGKAEADELIRRFYDTFSGFEEWQREMERFARKNLYVESMFGRRRHFVQPPSWTSPAGRRILRQAVNAPIQGDASAITNIGICQAMDRMKREALRSLGYLTVHDSMLADIEPTEALQVFKIVRDEMENPNTEQFGVTLGLPLVVDIKAGPSWGECSDIEEFVNGSA